MMASSVGAAHAHHHLALPACQGAHATPHIVLLPPARPAPAPSSSSTRQATMALRLHAIGSRGVDGLLAGDSRRAPVPNAAPPRPPAAAPLQPPSIADAHQAAARPQPPASSSSDAARRPTINARRLTVQIRSCTEWGQLEALYRQQQAHLSAANLLALLHHLTKVPRQKQMTRFEDSDAVVLVVDVVTHLLRVLPDAPPSPPHSPQGGLQGEPPHVQQHRLRSRNQQHYQQDGQQEGGAYQQQPNQPVYMSVRVASNVLWACGKLRVSPGLVQVGALLDAMEPLLRAQQGCDVMSMGQCVWALARLGHEPSPEWLQAYVHAATVVAPEATPQAISNILWALATLRVPTSDLEGLLPPLLARSLETMQDHTPQALGNIAWALAELRVHPGRAWMQSFLQLSKDMAQRGAGGTDTTDTTAASHHGRGRALPTCNPVDVAQMLWLPAHLPQCVTSVAISTATAAAARRSGGSAGGAAGAAAASGKAPFSRAEWVKTLLRCFASHKARATKTKEVVMVLVSLMQLKQRPPAGWALFCTSPQRLQLGRMTATEASHMVVALARLRAEPHAELQPAWLQASMACMPYFTAWDCAHIVLALGTLRWEPPRRWLAAMHEATFERLPSFNAEELVILVYGWAKLARWPPQVWLDRFFLQSLRMLAGLSMAQLCGLLGSLAQGQVRPPQQWLARWFAVSRPRLHSLSGTELARCAHALSLLRCSPSQDWTDAFLSCMDAAAASTLAAGVAHAPQPTTTSSSSSSSPSPRGSTPSPPAGQQGAAVSLQHNTHSGNVSSPAQASHTQAGDDSSGEDVAEGSVKAARAASLRRKQLRTQQRMSGRGNGSPDANSSAFPPAPDRAQATAAPAAATPAVGDTGVHAVAGGGVASQARTVLGAGVDGGDGSAGASVVGRTVWLGRAEVAALCGWMEGQGVACPGNLATLRTRLSASCGKASCS